MPYFCNRSRKFFHSKAQLFVYMMHFRPIAKTLVTVVFIISCSFSNHLFAQPNGQALFSSNCASCHAPYKDLTGPALAGVEERWGGDKKRLHAWVHNNQAFLKTGDKYANELYLKWNKTQMNLFPGLADTEIDAILAYIKSVPPPGSDTGGGGGAAAPAESGDNTLLFGILTLILAVVALTLLQINSNLKKLSDDKEGHPALEPVPFWRNKAYIATVIVLLFCIGGYLTVTGAIGLGRSPDYHPDQPIYYSHKVHAGTNQISCLYCHGGAQESKHANIPSVNICMNCHMAINSYSGRINWLPKMEKTLTVLQKFKSYMNLRDTILQYLKYGMPVKQSLLPGTRCMLCLTTFTSITRST